MKESGISLEKLENWKQFCTDRGKICKIDPCLGKLLPGEKYGVSWKRRIVKKLAEKFNELDKLIYLHKLSAKRISH